MEIWFVPFLLVTLAIIAVTYVSVRKTMDIASSLKREDVIDEQIQEHPFTLNPIIWVIFLATIFIFIVIVYYAVTI